MEIEKSFGDYLCEQGVSPSYHDSIINLVNSVYDRRFTVNTLVDETDQELVDIVDKSIKEWEGHRLFVMEAYEDDYEI